MEQTSYIPEPFCVLGKALKLRDADGIWDNGWEVVFASQNRYADKEVNENSRMHLKTRKYSDI